MRYPWPGNVRELENACERIAQTCICDAVVAGCVPAAILFHKSKELRSGTVGAAAPAVAHEEPASAPPSLGAGSLEERLSELEVELITRALRTSRGNKTKAAALLNVKRSTLGDRIKKLGLRHLEAAGPA